MHTFTSRWAQKITYLIICCLFSSVAWAQQTVTGTVVGDDSGEPLAGATVLIKGTTEGAFTDDQGRFTVSVPNLNATLTVSFLNYLTQDVALNGRREVSIKLIQDISSLEEIIITGYTAQSRREVTGAVTSIDAEALNEIPQPSLTQQLQGRAAGVMVGQDNRPGGGAMVRIRGFGTINNNDPLYVIDGIPTKGGLNQINPANVESIQILKDASAASIYGSRAANGVVIITTKKGKVGAPKVNFSVRGGIQQATQSLDLANTQQLGEILYLQQRNDYIVATGSADGFEFNHGQYGPDPNASNFIPDYIFPSGAFEGDPRTNPANYSAVEPFNLITRANKTGTDWYDEIYQTAPLQEYNLNVSGGTGRSNYFVGLNYYNQEGTVIHTNFERYSIRANSELSPKSWLRIGENLEVAYSETVSFTNNTEGNAISNTFRTQPIIPVYDINGFFAGNKGSNLGNGDNPVAILARDKDDVGENWRFFGNAYIEVDFLKNFTFKTQFGADFGTFYGPNWIARNIEDAEAIAANGLSVTANNSLTWTWYNTLNYTNTFADVHKVGVLLGTEAIEGNFRQLTGARNQFFSDDLDYRYLNAGETSITNGHFGSHSSLFSYFGKINYSLADKYLLDVTVRRDGSSRFGPENRYAVFPAFSLGWRLSDEAFLQGADWLTDLKLRGGWGQMGNQEIPNDNAYTTFRTSLVNSSYDLNGSNTSVVPGFDSQRFGNLNGKWETTTTTNVGFDATLFNQLTINFDWYDKTTTDMLYQLGLPFTQGEATAPFQNVAEMNNTGIDLGLAYSNTAMGGDLSYNIAANFSTYKNEVISLGDNANEVLIGPSRRQYSYTRSITGQPISSFYGLIIDGFTTQADVGSGEYDAYYDRPGRYKYRDINGDGLITDDDRTFIGSPHPDFTYGLNLNIQYKNFDVTMFFQGVQGNDLLNYVNRWIDFVTFQGNRSVKMLTDSWTPENPNASLPVLSAGDNLSYQPSSYFVEDGSYFRMKNLQIGYNFPTIAGIDNLRLYFQATNLFTITDYSGLDPEVNIQFGNNNMFGFDEGIYPTPQQFILGLNLGL